MGVLSCNTDVMVNQVLPPLIYSCINLGEANNYLSGDFGGIPSVASAVNTAKSRITTCMNNMITINSWVKTKASNIEDSEKKNLVLAKNLTYEQGENEEMFSENYSDYQEVVDGLSNPNNIEFYTAERHLEEYILNLDCEENSSMQEMLSNVLTTERADRVKTILNSKVHDKWDYGYLTARKGWIDYKSVKGENMSETWCQLNPIQLVENIRKFEHIYMQQWIREDGVHMYGPYVMVAADVKQRDAWGGDRREDATYKYGDIVETSLGTGIIIDLCERSMNTRKETKGEKIHYDIYTNWDKTYQEARKEEYVLRDEAPDNVKIVVYPEAFPDEIQKEIVENTNVNKVDNNNEINKEQIIAVELGNDMDDIDSNKKITNLNSENEKL